MIRIEYDEVDKIVEILENGGVVALPTDTVYGLVALYDAENVLDKIYRAKKRMPEKKIPFLAQSPDMINKFLAKEIPENAQKLMQRIDSGGITYILPAKEEILSFAEPNGSIAVRIPNSRLLSAIFEKIGKPLLATSANISGEKIARNVSEVSYIFEGKIDAVVDGNPGASKASTIISFMGNLPEILRAGVEEKEHVRAIVETKTVVYFVCTGNSCRSPLAEAYASRIAPDYCECYSAGISAMNGFPISKNSAQIITELELDSDKFKTKLLTEVDVMRADLILTMEKQQKKIIKEKYGVDYVYTLSEFAKNRGKIKDNGKYEVELKSGGEDIFDPIGRDLAFYYRVFFEIKEYVDAIF